MYVYDEKSNKGSVAVLVAAAAAGFFFASALKI